MKVLNELKLRESALLKYYERICLSDKMEDRILIRDVNDALFLLQAKIWEVERNKIKFIDNPDIIYIWLEEFNNVYEMFN